MFYILKYSDLPTNHPALRGSPPPDNIAFITESEPSDDLPWQEIGAEDLEALRANQIEWSPPPEPAPLSEEEKWLGLSGSLRGSEVFGLSYTASKLSPGTQMAMTLLIDALSNRNIADLRFAFNDLRMELAAMSLDFNAAQLGWIQERLEEWQFDLADFNLD